MILATVLHQMAWPCEYCFISEHGYVFDMNRTVLRFDTRLQSFSGLTNSLSLTDNVSTRYVTTFFTVNYASGRWGCTIALPLVYRYQRSTFTGTSSLHYQHVGRIVSTIDSTSLESNSVGGLGDATALIRYAFLSVSGKEFVSAFIQGGVKVATGSIDARDSFGFLLHPHLQVGTGTTLVLFGVSGSYGGLRQSIDASVLAGVPLHAEGPFREGAAFNYDVTFHVRLFPEDAEDGVMLVQHLGVVGRLGAKERYKEADVPDSGGHYLFLSAGLSFFPLPELNIDLFAQIPMVKNLAGNQLNEQFRLASGIQLAL